MSEPLPDDERRPIKELLDAPTDGEEVEAVRARLFASLDELENARGSSQRGWTWQKAAPLLAAAALLLIVLGGLRWWGPWGGAGSEVAPLTLADGGAFTGAEAEEGSATVELADGSSIRLEAGAALEVRKNEAGELGLLLSRGAAFFSVRPGGPRRWRIDMGAIEVEVVGTRFRLERAAEGLSVEVERGRVRVSGAALSGSPRALGAGESIRLPVEAARQPEEPAPGGHGGQGERAGAAEVDEASEGTAEASETGGAPSSRGETEATASPQGARSSGGTPASLPSWRRLAREHDYEAAYQSLGPAGLSAEVARAGSAGELFDLADTARLSGHPREAVAPLERLLAQHPREPRAALAAFTLGKIYMDTLGRPAEAATAFERATQLGLPATLRESGAARLIRAYVAAGRQAEAGRAACAYLRDHPSGPYAARARERCGEVP